ncbi:MAG TPA: hypothetical protein VMH22_04490 [bacterium]|nr:hypothetical protein [bacterium]
MNRAGLARDVRLLLAGCSVKPRTIKVTMGDRTRTGMVEITATSADIAAIVSRFGLQEGGTAEDDSDRHSWLDARVRQFNHPLLLPQDGVKVFRSNGRSENLRLSNGTAFDYMLLFWDKDKGVAVILLSYAYG